MPEKPETLESIVLAALDRATPEDRAGFLDSACGADAELRRRAERMLAADGQVADFLEQSPLHQLTKSDLDLLAARKPSAVLETKTDGDEYTQSDLPFPPHIKSPFLSSDYPGSLGRLGVYEVLEEVGRGGLGVVFKAIDTKLDRVVAIKIPLPEVWASASSRKRFLREARAAAAVAHEQVVTIYAVDETGDVPFLVMEFIEGRSLQQVIDRDGRLDANEIVRIAMQIAAGLAAASAQGLIHRDVKPANILLENGTQRVRITDFGLARAVNDAAITKTGELAGTPLYMSPEQAAARPFDHRSDLFSLGSVSYTMCSGHPPFLAETAYGVIRLVCEEPPRPLSEINPELPPWLIEIVDRLMAKSPDDRFQSAAEVAQLLEACSAHLAQPESFPLPAQLSQGLRKLDSSPLPATRRRRRALVGWLLTAATLAALVLFGVYIATRPDNRQPPSKVRPVDGAANDSDTEQQDDNAPLAYDLVVPVYSEFRKLDDSIDMALYVAYLPDGKRIVVAGFGGTTVVDATTGEVLQRMPGIGIQKGLPFYQSTCLSASGRQLFSSSVKYVPKPIRSHHIVCYDLSMPPSAKTYENLYGVPAVSPDGKFLVGQVPVAVMQMVDVESGSPVQQFVGHEQMVRALEFSPDGSLLASASEDNTIRVWDVESGQQLHSFPGHMYRTGIHPALEWMPDGKTLLTSGGDAIVREWNVSTGKEVSNFNAHSFALRGLAVSADGSRLLTCCENEITIKLWDLPQKREIARFRGHKTLVMGVAFSPDEKSAVSVSADKTIRLWRLPAIRNL